MSLMPYFPNCMVLDGDNVLITNIFLYFEFVKF